MNILMMFVAHLKNLITMNYKITIICLIFSITLSTAQERTTLAFLPITYDETIISRHESRLVQEAVVNAFVASRKFSIVDREKIEELEKEKDLQRSGAFIDSQSTFTDGLSKGANYIVDTSIMMLRYVDEKDKWDAIINVQFKMLNVTTGEIMYTHNISSEYQPHSDAVLKAMKSYFSRNEFRAIEAQIEDMQSPRNYKEDAFTQALQRLGENTRKYAGTLLPTPVEIVEWDSKKNEIVLGMGSAMGVEVGNLADVVKISLATIGGNEVERHEVIGTAWIYQVDDQNFSKATIIENSRNVSRAERAGENIGIILK